MTKQKDASRTLFGLAAVIEAARKFLALILDHYQ